MKRRTTSEIIQANQLKAKVLKEKNKMVSERESMRLLEHHLNELYNIGPKLPADSVTCAKFADELKAAGSSTGLRYWNELGHRIGEIAKKIQELKDFINEVHQL